MPEMQLFTLVLYYAWKHDWRGTEEEIQHSVIDILHNSSPADVVWNSAALFGCVPSHVALQNNLHVDPDSRSNRETCGVIIQEAVSAFFMLLPFKNFLFISVYWLGILSSTWGHFFFLEPYRIFHTKTATIFLSSFHCQETKPRAALKKFKESISQPGPAAVRCLASDRTRPSDRPYSVFKWSARDALCLKFIPAQDCEHSVQ